MRGDLSVHGLAGTLPRRIAASATRYEAGEPLYTTATYSSGALSSNTYVLAAADLITVGTNMFGGVALNGALPYKTGTLTAHTARTINPVPMIGIIRGKAYASTSIDTAAEALGVIGDIAMIDYNATGGADGGEKYTIVTPTDSGAWTPADTAGFSIAEASVAKGTIDIVCYGTIYRADIT